MRKYINSSNIGNSIVFGYMFNRKHDRKAMDALVKFITSKVLESAL